MPNTDELKLIAKLNEVRERLNAESAEVVNRLKNITEQVSERDQMRLEIKEYRLRIDQLSEIWAGWRTNVMGGSLPGNNMSLFVAIMDAAMMGGSEIQGFCPGRIISIDGGFTWSVEKPAPAPAGGKCE